MRPTLFQRPTALVLNAILLAAVVLAPGCARPEPRKNPPAHTRHAPGAETAKPAIQPAPGEQRAPPTYSVHREHEKEKLGQDPE